MIYRYRHALDRGLLGETPRMEMGIWRSSKIRNLEDLLECIFFDLGHWSCSKPTTISILLDNSVNLKYNSFLLYV